MGSGASVLPEQIIQDLEKTTNFTSKEIIKILQRYTHYDTDNFHSIPIKYFLDIPEVSTIPIMPKVAALFLDPATKGITPQNFVNLFSMLSSRTPLEKRKKFAFKVLDTDGNGFLSQDEMFSFYRLLLGPTLTDKQILNIVMTTNNKHAANKQGLSYQDFLKLVSDEELKNLFTVDLQLP
ncbi:calcineurin subunit B-like [Actinia tenebrosa]|uniref:Calcineurin subunit B-like n=1 Tax=Actinia tenebrosa TaxID=6105 RepID=A0A6P8ILG5_ACTTE|nr:calcineurin subunit B-like [Actinia tenebrosa]